VEPNEPPTARFSATPNTGEAPLAVSFDASASSDPDGTIVRYDWAFGDGTTGTGETTSHTYTTAGTFQACN
jgi:PKD repeat protein